MLHAADDRSRPRRQLYGFPEANRRELLLGPRRGGLGLFTDLARRWTDGTAGRPAVRPLRSAPHLFAGAAAARRLFPDCLARAGAPLLRDRCGHPHAVAGFAGADRPDRLARRLSMVRHRGAVHAGAAAVAAMADDRHGLAARGAAK